MLAIFLIYNMKMYFYVLFLLMNNKLRKMNILLSGVLKFSKVEDSNLKKYMTS
jgi:hypothetical protein